MKKQSIDLDGNSEESEDGIYYFASDVDEILGQIRVALNEISNLKETLVQSRRELNFYYTYQIHETLSAIENILRGVK